MRSLKVSVEREVGGAVVVLGEHAGLLPGGALDAAQAGFRCLGGLDGLDGLRGVGFRLVLGEAGVGGVFLGFRDSVPKLGDVFRTYPLAGEGGLVDAGGVEDGDGFINVGELAAVEVSARGGGIR